MSKKVLMTGKKGLYQRHLKSDIERTQTIQRLSKIPDTRRSPDDWWELGQNLVTNGLLKQDESIVQDGMKFLKRATEANPPSIAAFMDLAWLLMHRHMEMFALEYLVKASQYTDTSRDLYAMLGLCYARLGNREQALKAMTRATLSPHVTQIDYELKSALETKDSDEYIKLAKSIQFFLINPKDAFEAGFSKQEIMEIIRFTSNESQNMENDVCFIENTAEIDYFSNDYDSARQGLKRIISSNEATAKSYVLLGLMAFKESDLEAAEQYYLKALELEPENYLACVNYTSMLSVRQEYTQDVINRMIWAVNNPDENDPRTSAAAFSNLGNYFSTNGEFDKDVELQEASLQLYIDETLATPINLFLTFLTLGKVSKAERLFDKFRKNFKYNNAYEIGKILLKNFKAAERNPMAALELGFKILNQELPFFNEHSVLPLVEQSFSRAKKIPNNLKEEYYQNLGYLAGSINNRKISATCWQKLAAITDNKVYYMNYAIDLVSIGDIERAVKIIDDLPDSIRFSNERTCNISAVIYSSSKRYSETRISLEKGLDIDPSFSLLYSGLINLCQLDEMRSDQQQILESIINRIDANTNIYNLRYFRGYAESLMGQIELAAEHMIYCFFDGDRALNYQEMLQRDALKNQIDTSDSFDIFAYKNAAQILYRAGRLVECNELIVTMREDPKLSDGDGLVGLQTIARRSPNMLPDKSILENMGLQIPVLIESAIIAIDEQDTIRAQEFLNQIDDTIDASDFFHLEGKQNALIQAIRAHCQYYTGHESEAMKSLQLAIEIDSQAPFIYETFIDISGETNDALIKKILEQGNARLIGSPWLKLKELSKSVDIGDFQKTTDLIRNYKGILKPLLPDGRYQSFLEAVVLSSNSNSTCPDWITEQSFPQSDWLLKAYQLMKSEHNEAALIYLFKWIEEQMNQRFRSFKDKHKFKCHFQQDTPFSAFIEQGKDKMNLGAMVKTLDIGLRPSSYKKPEQLIVSYFQQQSKFLNDILNHNGLNQLKLLAHIRNCLMHITPVNESDVIKVRRWLLTDDGNIGEISAAFWSKVSTPR